jgi:hypothetical protein
MCIFYIICRCYSIDTQNSYRMWKFPSFLRSQPLSEISQYFKTFELFPYLKYWGIHSLFTFNKKRKCFWVYEFRRHLISHKDRYSKSNTTGEYIIAKEFYSHNVDCVWNVMAHGDARAEKWRGNKRMEWVTSKGRFTHSTPCPCRAHAVPLPCRAAKGLECVFPICFT